MGRANAPVFPEPVSARPMMSRPGGEVGGARIKSMVDS